MRQVFNSIVFVMYFIFRLVIIIWNYIVRSEALSPLLECRRGSGEVGHHRDNEATGLWSGLLRYPLGSPVIYSILYFGAVSST